MTDQPFEAGGLDGAAEQGGWDGMADDLRELCAAALIGGLPTGLKAELDRLLAAGVSRKTIAARVRARMLALGDDPRAILGLAIEAYLENE